MEYTMIKRSPLIPLKPDHADERRTERRRRLSLPLQHPQTIGGIADLSTTGAYITGLAGGINSEIDLRFCLPDGLAPITAKARIVWSSTVKPVAGGRAESAMGVEFILLDTSAHQKLKDFLEIS